MRITSILFISIFAAKVFAQDTFSIIAVDPATGEIGSAGASCLDDNSFPGSGGAIIISDIIPGKGAIHTQSYWVAANQDNAHQKMLEGLSPEDLILWLRQNDVEGIFGQFKRQYGIVDFDSMGQPRSAAFTGSSCLNWKGHLLGENYAIQGNILLGPQILDSIEARFLASEGQPLSIRLMHALQGANVVGADSRCAANGTSSLSAFIRMAQPGDDANNIYLDLNVPALPAGMEPIDSLQRLFDQWLLVKTKDLYSPKFTLFPNPCKGGDFQIEWTSPKSGELSISNLSGQLISAKQVKPGINYLQAQLLPGIYTVSIIPEGNMEPIKQRLVVY